MNERMNKRKNCKSYFKGTWIFWFIYAITRILSYFSFLLLLHAILGLHNIPILGAAVALILCVILECWVSYILILSLKFFEFGYLVKADFNKTTFYKSDSM